MPIANVNGQSINYVDSGGDGTAIIFSHGFLMDLSMFDSQVEALKENIGASLGMSAVSVKPRSMGRLPTGIQRTTL